MRPQGKEPGQRDTAKNRGRLGGIRQTLGYLQKRQDVQLMCAASYDIWCRGFRPVIAKFPLQLIPVIAKINSRYS